MNILEKAIKFATDAHSGQVRKYTGEPYIFHPLEVAGMAIKHGLPEWAVCAAILHDVVEDCGVDFNTLRDEFGVGVALAVMGLTEISKSEDGNRALRKAMDLEWYSQQSPEVQSVKVLDMISNSRSIKKYDKDFWEIYRREKLALLDALELADYEMKHIAYIICKD